MERNTPIGVSIGPTGRAFRLIAGCIGLTLIGSAAAACNDSSDGDKGAAEASQYISNFCGLTTGIASAIEPAMKGVDAAKSPEDSDEVIVKLASDVRTTVEDYQTQISNLSPLDVAEADASKRASSIEDLIDVLDLIDEGERLGDLRQMIFGFGQLLILADQATTISPELADVIEDAFVEDGVNDLEQYLLDVAAIRSDLETGNPLFLGLIPTKGGALLSDGGVDAMKSLAERYREVEPPEEVADAHEQALSHISESIAWLMTVREANFALDAQKQVAAIEEGYDVRIERSEWASQYCGLVLDAIGKLMVD